MSGLSRCGGQSPVVSPFAGAGLCALSGVHVLLVEHEPEVRANIARALELNGATVTAVDSAAKAFKAAREEHPGVLITEIGMPYVNGRRLVRSLRMLDAPAFHAVALTKADGDEDRGHLQIHGFQLELSKALHPVDLAARVRDLAHQCR